MTGPRYTCVPGEPLKLSEVHIDRVAKALWDGSIRCREPIVSSDILALEAVRQYDAMWRDPIGEKRARLERRVSPAQELTEWLEEIFLSRPAIRMWRGDVAAARAAGQRAVVRYAHEVRGR